MKRTESVLVVPQPITGVLPVTNVMGVSMSLGVWMMMLAGDSSVQSMIHAVTVLEREDIVDDRRVGRSPPRDGAYTVGRPRASLPSSLPGTGACVPAYRHASRRRRITL